MQNQSFNPNDILVKMKKTPSAAVISIVFGVIFAVVGLIGLIIMLLGNMVGIALLIAGILLGALFIVIAILKINKNKEEIKHIDFDAVLGELYSGYIPFENLHTYFTNSFIISNHYAPFIVNYMDIAWIYEISRSKGKTVGTDLVINMLNGDRHTLVSTPNFIELIRSHNPGILFGLSNENRTHYKQKVRDYLEFVKKNGGNTTTKTPMFNQTPMDYMPMSKEDPIYQFNQISKEMREAQNNPGVAPEPVPHVQPEQVQPAPQVQVEQAPPVPQQIGIITPGENGFNQPVNNPPNNGQMQ